MQYDIFISYARKDNQEGRITELKEHLEQEYKAFSGKPLSCFFDKQEIKSMDDWKHRLLHGLKNSQILLIVLSPSYIESKYCEWEVVEYIKHEYARALQGEGIAQVYFVEIPGIDDESFKESIAWLKKISGRQRIDLQAWKESGMDALKREDVKERMTEFQHSLHNRISRIKRIKEAKGNLPRPNPNFIGRQAEMKKLHEALCFGTLGSYAAVHGMGGMGKTSIAFQYAYVYADFYTGGRWRMPCENQHNLNAILRGLDGHLGIFYTDEEKKDDEKAAIRILNELEKRALEGAEGQDKEPSVLLILDNVDDAQILKSPQYDIVSGKPWLKILVTTRLGKKTLGMRNPENYVTIDELPAADALSLIESFQAGSRFPNQEEENSAKEIVDLLDGFTLAIEIAATYLGEKQGAVTCADFATLLKREGSLKGIDLVANVSEHDIAHEKLISLTLTSTVEALSEEERLILNYAALLPPDTIPLPWLRALAGKKYPKLLVDAPIGLEDPWLATINKLLSKRLLQMNNIKEDSNRIVKMHRLLQDVIRTESIHLEKLITEIIDLLIDRVHFLQDEWFIQENRWEIEPIQEICMLLAHKGVLDFIKIAIPFYEIVCSFFINSRTIKIYSDYVDLFKANSPEQEIDLARLRLCFARASNLTRGASPKILKLLLDSLHTIKTKQPSNLLLIGEIYQTIAEYYFFTAQFENAEKYIHHSLSCYNESKSDHYRSIARSLSSQIDLYISLGQLNKASLSVKKAQEFYEKSYKPNHYRLMFLYRPLARLENIKTNMPAAAMMMKKVLKIEKASLVKNHPSIGLTLLSVGSIESMNGNWDDAEAYYQDALFIFDKNLAPFHPHFMDLYMNLANLELHKGNFETAKSYMEKLAQIEKQHNVNRGSFFNINKLGILAEIDSGLGDYKEALVKYKKTIEDIVNKLNSVHPNLITCNNGIGLIYLELGQLSAAEEHFKRAYSAHLAIIQEEDELLLKIQKSLEKVMRALGRSEEEIYKALNEKTED